MRLKDGTPANPQPRQDARVDEPISVDLEGDLGSPTVWRERYHALLSLVPALVLRVRRDGTYMAYHGPSEVPTWATSPRAVLGRTIREIMPAEAADERMAAIERAFTTGEPQCIRYESLVHGATRMREQRLTVCGPDEVIAVIRDHTEHRQAEITVKHLEENLRSLFENVPDLVMTLAPDGLLVFVNRTAPGVAMEELIGTSIYEHLPAGEIAAMRSGIERALASGRSGSFDVAGIRFHGAARKYVCRIGAVRLGGQVVALTLVATDVTEQERVLDALRESDERYRGLVQGSSEAIFITAPDGRVVDFNQAALDLFGFTRDELPSVNVTALYREPADRDRFRVDIERTGSVRDYDVKLRRRDGVLLDCLLTATTRRARDGTVLGYQGIVRDITRRRWLERRMLDVAEREQRRIGQDLHDGLGQLLTGIAFLSKVLVQKLDATGAPELADARKIEALIADAIGQTRKLAKGLQPVALDSAGLAVALEEMCSNVTDVFGVPCTCELCSDIDVHDESVANNVYHIAREAVNNAIKHSKASAVHVGLCRDGRWTTLTVEDDGVGIPMEQSGEGLGLQIMRYRTNLIGGLFELRGGAGSGTTVRCTFPVATTQGEARRA
jgi:PAS domain S-box-containing protein